MEKNAGFGKYWALFAHFAATLLITSCRYISLYCQTEQGKKDQTREGSKQKEAGNLKR